MPENNDKINLEKQSLMGHLRLLPKILFFAMLAYGFVKLLIWISRSIEGNI